MTREAHEAEPSQVCGAPAQHQPSRGSPPLIQNAVTRLSPQREPSIEKQLRVFSSCGKWAVVNATSSTVSGDRLAARIHFMASSGGLCVATRVEIDREIGGHLGHGDTLDWPEPKQLVGIHAGEAVPSAPLDGGDRLACRDECASDHDDEWDALVGRSRREITCAPRQRFKLRTEFPLGHPREPGITRVHQRLDLTIELLPRFGDGHVVDQHDPPRGMRVDRFNAATKRFVPFGCQRAGVTAAASAAPGQ